MGSPSWYFFQQKTSRKTPKRFRKSPEELPQELRFAHLNPRVAAYLASKEKEKLSEEGSQADVAEAQGQGKSILSNIQETLQLIQQEIGGFDDSKEEDLQRSLYNESKTNAANVLLELGKILYLFQEGKPPHIPKGLEYLLLCSFNELSAEAQVEPRDWQLPDNRDAYLKKQAELNNVDERSCKSVDNESIKSRQDHDNKKKKKPLTLQKTSLTDISEDEGLGGKESAMSKLKRGDSALSTAPSDASPTILKMKRVESKESSSIKPPKTRLEKYKSNSLYVERKGSEDSQMAIPASRKTSFRPEEVASAIAETESTRSVVAGPTGPGGYIHFQLSSRLCEQKGWILHKGGKDDPERETILEWARQRLQLSIRNKKEQQVLEKEMGYDKPVVVRHYGDVKQDHHRKGGPIRASQIQRGNVPEVPSMTSYHGEGRQLFQSTVPDGSTTVFYLSGRPAIISSCSGVGKPGFYVFAFDDTYDNRMLACFTPTGKGCCYHDNGYIRFLAFDKGGTLADEQGVIHKQWTWPHNNIKLPGTIFINLNRCLTFRCVNQSQMQLVFSCQKELAKVNCGIDRDAIEPKTHEDMGHLVSGFQFSSQTAKEYIKPPKKREKDRDKEEKIKAKAKHQKMKMKDKAMAQEIQRILDSQEPSEDPESDRDLQRLQRKIRNLVEDWMEHYRLAIGMSSPHIHNLSDYPRRNRQVHSAKYTPMRTPYDLRPSVSKRAPSAPAQSQLPRPSTSPAIYENVTECLEPDGVVQSVKFEEGKLNEESSASPAPNELYTDIVTLQVPSTPYSNVASTPSRSHRTRSPVKSAATVTSSQADRVWSLSMGTCPVALRQELLGEESTQCRCSRHKIPYITDVELDEFLQNKVPEKQIIIIAVISTYFPEALPCEEMLEDLHVERNRNRTKPCLQARNDSFRIFKYDVATASEDTEDTQPLLLHRHNVVPGMFLMYEAGHLMFCDHIFNGYGYTRKDFHKQVVQMRMKSSIGQHLPRDFRFSPAKGRRGNRAAWGGEIGGTGVDTHASPGTSLELHDSTSRVSLSSDGSKDLPTDYNLGDDESASKYFSLSLSAAGYQPRIRSMTAGYRPPQTIITHPVYPSGQSINIPDFRKSQGVK